LLHSNVVWKHFYSIDTLYRSRGLSAPAILLYDFFCTVDIMARYQLLNNNNTLPLHQLHNFFILMLLHKFKFNGNELPEPFWVYFTENYTIHSHNTRQIENIHLGRKNTTLGRRSIKFKGGKLWNDIPSTIKLFRNEYTFKRKLKLYLINT
jgi:hypothetical protein